MTNRQLDVLDFIKRFIASEGHSPTVREIAAGLALKSPSTAQEHLKALVQNGMITMDKQKSRTIELLVQNEYVKTSDNTVNIPLLERVFFEVPKKFLEIPIFMTKNYDPKKLYAFKKGKSIYIVSTKHLFAAKPSLTIDKRNHLELEEFPTKEILGNIISEFKIY